MAEHTAISWTDATFNPWWGCTKVGPGCDACYAEAQAARFGTGWGNDAPRRFFGEAHWNEPRKWNRKAAAAGRRSRVFCASMADVFDNQVEQVHRDRLWALIRDTPALDWLLVTKRIGNAAAMLPADWGAGYANAWLLITVVNQAEADRDVPKLLSLPARVRGLSVEPMLGPIDLTRVCLLPKQPASVRAGIHVDALAGRYCESGLAYKGDWDITQPPPDIPAPRLDWVICGGESDQPGHDPRPMHPDWARALRDQCSAAGVAFHFKQWGAWLTPAGIDPDNPPHVAVKPAWMREDGFIRECALPFSSEDVPHDGKVQHHAWVKAARVGKQRAGRTLDGRTWDEFPRGEQP